MQSKKLYFTIIIWSQLLFLNTYIDSKAETERMVDDSFTRCF
jgi:hypothetical protein